mgnify:FL=1
MKRLACLLALLPLGFAEDAPPKPADRLAQLSWLAGTWSGPMWGGTFTAHYSTPEGGRILSHSELLRGDKVAFFEFEVFRVKGDAVVYEPYPGGKPAVPFTLATLEGKRAVFENPKKDFPTRVTFHRAADDRLVVTLDDPHGGSGKTETFDLKR